MTILVLQFLLFFCDRNRRYYRWPLQWLLPKTTSAYEKSLMFRAEVEPEVTPGSTGIPVLPVLTAEVPPRRVLQSAVGALIPVGR